jgi:hypothetical protein
MNRPNPTSRSRRRKWWLLGVLLVAIAIQSITITPGVRLKYLSAYSGTSIEGLRVVAVWRLRSGNLGGSLDAGVIRILEARTDQQGDVRIGAAVMFHVPVFPFSPLYRDVEYLPVVFADDGRHKAIIVASGLRPREGVVSTSFLSYQQAALDGEILRLEQSEKSGDVEHRDRVREEIQQAHFSCRQSRICNEVES